ncbi:MAG: DUF5678 domain-containing protein [Solirubrobacterales bacterium]
MNSEGRTLSPEQVAAAEKRLAEDLKNYDGEWVAIADHRVVDSAAQIADLRERADSTGLQVDSYLEVAIDDAIHAF